MRVALGFKKPGSPVEPARGFGCNNVGVSRHTLNVANLIDNARAVLDNKSIFFPQVRKRCPRRNYFFPIRYEEVSESISYHLLKLNCRETIMYKIRISSILFALPVSVGTLVLAFLLLLPCICCLDYCDQHTHCSCVDVPFGKFTQAEIDALASVAPNSKLSTKTPPIENFGPTNDVVTIVIDFKEPGQPDTSDIFGNVVSSFDVTSYGFTASQFAMVTEAIFNELQEDFFDELTGTPAKENGLGLDINFIIGDIGIAPPGISEYYFVQVGSGVSGPQIGALGVAGGSVVRNSSGQGPNNGIQVGDVVSSTFTNTIQGIGGLNPSNALTSGNLGFTTNAVVGTLSHEVGHVVSLSHINNAGSVQPTPGAAPLLGTGAIDLPNQLRITDREFSLSGFNDQAGGEAVFHIPQLVDALGLAPCVGLGIEFPSGLPQSLAPGGGTTFRVEAFNDGEEPQPGTGQLHFDTGNGFATIAMTVVSPNVYDAVFPPVACGTTVQYFVTVDSVSGATFSSPFNAPDSTFSVISTDSINLTFDDDFEGNLGWTVTGDATDGQWNRGVPVGGGDRGDPADDGDGSGACYLTDNVDGNSDVDGGSTTLTSPLMDATVTGGGTAILSYFRWYSNTAGAAPGADIFVIEISNDNGQNWINLETVGPDGPESDGGWFFQSFDVASVMTPTNQMRVRFTASDLGDGSVVEAGVDGVKIEILDCGSGTELVSPASFNTFRGLLIDGDATDVAASDDSYLRHNPGFTLNSSEPPVWIDFDANLSSDAPVGLEALFETSANTPGLTQTVEVRNWTTGQFELMDSRDASFNSDAVTSVDLASGIPDYVEGGSAALQVRVGFRITGFTLLFPWTTSIDQVQWSATY